MMATVLLFFVHRSDWQFNLVWTCRSIGATADLPSATWHVYAFFNLLDGFYILGATIDTTMSFDQHVANICMQSIVLPYSSTSPHQKTINDHRLSDGRYTACSRSSLLATWLLQLTVIYGITDRNINKLQWVQNFIARLVTNSHSICHITPVLAELHRWTR